MMRLTRWQRPELSVWPGFDRLSTLRDELDRLFEAPLAGLVRASSLVGGWTPALDLHEDKDQIVVKAELPGMKRENIEVSVHDGTLSISGERKSEENFQNAEVHRTERFFGRFQRCEIQGGTPGRASGMNGSLPILSPSVAHSLGDIYTFRQS